MWIRRQPPIKIRPNSRGTMWKRRYNGVSNLVKYFARSRSPPEAFLKSNTNQVTFQYCNFLGLSLGLRCSLVNQNWLSNIYELNVNISDFTHHAVNLKDIIWKSFKVTRWTWKLCTIWMWWGTTSIRFWRFYGTKLINNNAI